MPDNADKRSKRSRYLALLIVFLLAILLLIFFLLKLGDDSSSPAPATNAASTSAPTLAPSASVIVSAPGTPMLEAYAKGTSIGWQVTASADDGGSPYAGYEVELISDAKDIHADFPGNGSGAGMYAWTFGGQPTVMARTYNEAGLFSEWAAMLLPVTQATPAPAPSESTDATSKKRQPTPTATGSNREKPASLIGETPDRIVSLELLPPVLIDGGVPAIPLLPSAIPTPSIAPDEMPVTPITPSSSPTASASPSSSASHGESGGDSECTDGKKGNDKCEGKGSGDHPNDSTKPSPSSSEHGDESKKPEKKS